MSDRRQMTHSFTEVTKLVVSHMDPIPSETATGGEKAQPNHGGYLSSGPSGNSRSNCYAGKFSDCLCDDALTVTGPSTERRSECIS